MAECAPCEQDAIKPIRAENRISQRRKNMALVEQKLGFFESIVDFFMDYVVFPIQHITLINILDIALLAVLIYVVYKFIRDRNASRALIGFGLLLLLYMTSARRVRVWLLPTIIVCLLRVSPLRQSCKRVSGLSLWVQSCVSC